MVKKNARNIVGDAKPSLAKRLTDWVKIGVSYGQSAFQFLYMNSRMIGWMIVTTGMITALPIYFELRREVMLEELERLEIGQAMEAGKTPQELAASGLSSAIQPKVLK
jgi:hypothetical protein